jgi:hypothetical protein
MSSKAEFVFLARSLHNLLASSLLAYLSQPPSTDFTVLAESSAE